MSIDATFNAMRTIVEAAGYPYLRNYKDDFYKFDRCYLERTYTSEARYLWIVRENGTHLLSLGVHPMICEAAAAVFAVTTRLDLFMVQPGRVEPISSARARTLLADLRYSIQANVVTSAQTGRLATLQVEVARWSARGPSGIVRYTPLQPLAALRVADLTALAQIAECEVVAKSQSLFAETEAIFLGGDDLRDLLVSKR